MSEQEYIWGDKYRNWHPPIPEFAKGVHWYNGELYRDFRMFVFSTETVKRDGRHIKFTKLIKNTPNLPLYELREMSGFDNCEVVTEAELYTPYTFLDGEPLSSAFPEDLPEDWAYLWEIYCTTIESVRYDVWDDRSGSWYLDYSRPTFNNDLPLENGQMHVWQSKHGLAISRETGASYPIIEKFRELTV